MQQPGETLSQFWHAPNGLIAICDFGEITTTLVLDMFILHMSNKKVHEKLCTEPKETDRALDFAIAYEEGVKMQKPYFTMELVHFCMATNHRCKHCQIVGHLENCCDKKFPQRQKEMMQRLKSRESQQGMRRVNYIDESDGDEEDCEEDEEQLVQRVDGEGSKPFYMEGMMCDNYLKAIIYTGSPVSIFTKRGLQKIVGERKVVIRDMIGGERYVDYNRKPLKLLGYQFVRREVAGVTVSKARVLVAPNSGKSTVGRDWLVALRYKITQPIERGECEVINQSVNSDNICDNICEIISENQQCPQVLNSVDNSG